MSLSGQKKSTGRKPAGALYNSHKQPELVSQCFNNLDSSSVRQNESQIGLRQVCARELEGDCMGVGKVSSHDNVTVKITCDSGNSQYL